MVIIDNELFGKHSYIISKKTQFNILFNFIPEDAQKNAYITYQAH